MKRALLWFAVLTIAFVPVLNDVCDLGCDVQAGRTKTTALDPVCPLHPHGGMTPSSKAPVPDRCGHDHSVGRAGLFRTLVHAPQHVPLALMVSARMAGDRLRGSATSAIVPPHAPPIRAARPDVLRI